MNKQLEFLDILTMLGFALNVANLNENLTQSDKQDLMHETDKQSSDILSAIQQHLEVQDKKIDEILKRLEELK